MKFVEKNQAEEKTIGNITLLELANMCDETICSKCIFYNKDEVNIPRCKIKGSPCNMLTDIDLHKIIGIIK